MRSIAPSKSGKKQHKAGRRNGRKKANVYPMFTPKIKMSRNSLIINIVTTHISGPTRT